MIDTRALFHKISYLQYPLFAVAVFYAFKPYIVGFDTVWANLNNVLVFGGLGISLSTLQDTTTTQNEFSRRIWQSPTKGKIALILIAAMAFLFVFIGFFGIYVSHSPILKELSLGTIVVGIGVIGLLKAAIEMFENHRIDKNPVNEGDDPPSS
ncbi:MAG: hypothetical protein IPM50_10445 [Acidobacteriota bacterium]|nr:MAG: hypothetical protein IPM50_10445 [Acidobacteriota bacterium]